MLSLQLVLPTAASGKTYFQSCVEVVCSAMHRQKLPKLNSSSGPNDFCRSEWQGPSH